MVGANEVKWHIVCVAVELMLRQHILTYINSGMCHFWYLLDGLADSGSVVLISNAHPYFLKANFRS